MDVLVLDHSFCFLFFKLNGFVLLLFSFFGVSYLVAEAPDLKMVWHAGAGVIWLQGEPVDKGKVQLHLGTAGDKLDSGVRTERRTYT